MVRTQKIEKIWWIPYVNKDIEENLYIYANVI